jgi:hypothetical protein
MTVRLANGARSPPSLPPPSPNPPTPHPSLLIGVVGGLVLGRYVLFLLLLLLLLLLVVVVVFLIQVLYLKLSEAVSLCLLSVFVSIRSVYSWGLLDVFFPFVNALP